MLFKRPGIHPGNNIDTHSVRTIAAPCSLGLCLCSLPPWGHSLNCSLKASVVILSFHMAPSQPILQWVLFSLRVKFWFLKSPTSVLTTCSYASVRHPLPLLFPSLPSYPGPSCCSDTTRNLISAVLLMPPYHRRFPDPAEKKDSILSLPRSLSSRNW